MWVTFVAHACPETDTCDSCVRCRMMNTLQLAETAHPPPARHTILQERRSRQCGLRVLPVVRDRLWRNDSPLWLCVNRIVVWECCILYHTNMKNVLCTHNNLLEQRISFRPFFACLSLHIFRLWDGDEFCSLSRSSQCRHHNLRCLILYKL